MSGTTSDLISRQNVISILEAQSHGTLDGEPVYSAEIDTAMTLVEALPAAEVRPLVEAHWIVQEIKGHRRRTVRRLCSNCGANNLNRKSNYCPNCGADMRGKGGVRCD